MLASSNQLSVICSPVVGGHREPHPEGGAPDGVQLRGAGQDGPPHQQHARPVQQQTLPGAHRPVPHPLPGHAHPQPHAVSRCMSPPTPPVYIVCHAVVCGLWSVMLWSVMMWSVMLWSVMMWSVMMWSVMLWSVMLWSVMLWSVMLWSVMRHCSCVHCMCIFSLCQHCALFSVIIM